MGGVDSRGPNEVNGVALFDNVGMGGVLSETGG